MPYPTSIQKNFINLRNNFKSKKKEWNNTQFADLQIEWKSGLMTIYQKRYSSSLKSIPSNARIWAFSIPFYKFILLCQRYTRVLLCSCNYSTNFTNKISREQKFVLRKYIKRCLTYHINNNLELILKDPNEIKSSLESTPTFTMSLIMIVLLSLAIGFFFCIWEGNVIQYTKLLLTLKLFSFTNSKYWMNKSAHNCKICRTQTQENSFLAVRKHILHADMERMPSEKFSACRHSKLEETL